MREERKKKIVSIKVKLLGIILPVVIAIMILLAGILYFIQRILSKSIRKICSPLRLTTRQTRLRLG